MTLRPLHHFLVGALAAATCLEAARGQVVVPPPPPADHPVSLTLFDGNGNPHAVRQEVFLQLPAILGNSPLLLAFHGAYYNRYWQQTNGGNHPHDQELLALMAEAAKRGWIVASLEAHGPWNGVVGAHPASYGGPEMDQRITAVIDHLASTYGINDRRIYTIGHSMGAADAIAYAARHQDPYSWRIAAAWSWSGVLDVTNLDGSTNWHEFFYATGDYAADPLPYLWASSLKYDPNCPVLATCGVLGAGHEEDRSQIFNLADIPIRITHADSDACFAYCSVVTAQHFQNLHAGIPTLPKATFDTSFNSGHYETDDFNPIVICNYFKGKLLPAALPAKAYKTVATRDGRYGHFTVTLAGSQAPGVFGWEFFPASNALLMPPSGYPAAPVAGIAELRLRADDGSPFESPLVSNQYLIVAIQNATSTMDVVFEHWTNPNPPSLVKLNGSPTTSFVYDAMQQTLRLIGPAPGQLNWEVFP